MTGTAPGREPIPPGRVSTIRGARQIPALNRVVVLAGLLAAVGAVVPGSIGMALAVAAVVVITATPLSRVVWLIFRWRQEDDPAFVLRGAALLMIIAVGALIAFLRA